MSDNLIRKLHNPGESVKDGTPGSFGLRKREEAAGEGRMLEAAVSASADDAARGWSVLMDSGREIYVQDTNLTLERASEMRDSFRSLGLDTYRIETDERAAALEAAGSGAPESEIVREIEIAVRRREAAKWGRSTADIEGKAPNGERFDSISPVAPGIDFLSTPGHGFYSLSPERNKAIAPALRNRSGKYEEDCEQHIIAWTFPEAFPTRDHDAEAQAIRDWYPDGWEKATGQTLTPGESRTRDQATWTASHAADYLVTSASKDGDEHVIVSARLGGNGEEKRFRVATAEYQTRGDDNGDIGRNGLFVVDVNRHEEIATPTRTLTPVPQYTGVSVDGATPAARARIEKDLAKRWRGTGGEVRTLATIISRGLSGKSSWVDDAGKRQYFLSANENKEDTSHAYTVTKATWDAVDAPDTRTPVQVIREDLIVLEKQEKKAREDYRRSFFGRGDNASLGANLAKIEAKLTELVDKYAAATAAAAEAGR